MSAGEIPEEQKKKTTWTTIVLRIAALVL